MTPASLDKAWAPAIIIALVSMADWATVATPSAENWRALLPAATASTPTIQSVSVRASERKGKQASTLCKPDGARFQCADASWSYVGKKEDMVVGGKKTPCTWAHPLDKKTIIITHDTIDLEQGKTLLLETALNDRAVSGRGGHVDVRVMLGDKELARHKHTDRRGWQSLAIDGPVRGALTLEVSAPRTGRRHFCYKLTRKPRP